MIGRLRGVLVDVEGTLAIVDAGGVGYEVVVPESVLVQLPPMGEEVTLITRQVFREDGVTLYGFVEAFDRRLFDLLQEVKGCGPKVGLALIGQIGSDAVAGGILAQDAKTLVRATGVGARLAERIILELKDKIQEESFKRKIEAASSVRRKAPPADELVEALLALGYRRNEADTAAAEARANAEGEQDQLRYALRVLQK